VYSAGGRLRGTVRSDGVVVVLPIGQHGAGLGKGSLEVYREYHLVPRQGEASIQVEYASSHPRNNIHEGQFGQRNGGRRAATRGDRGARQWRLVGRKLRPLPLNALPPFLIDVDYCRRRSR
jgi:hypothetical protein